MRGFSAVGLWKPKDKNNIGSTLRAAYCYDVALVVAEWRGKTRAPTDTYKTWRHKPLIRTYNGDFWSFIPYDCVPIAVDLLEGATPLPEFQHPERAFYIFGPENGTLGRQVTERCVHSVMVPTRGCMNLAATVNVVLYDRLAKSMQQDGRN